MGLNSSRGNYLIKYIDNLIISEYIWGMTQARGERVEFDPARGFSKTIRGEGFVEMLHFGIPPLDTRPRRLLGPEPQEAPILDFHAKIFSDVDHKHGIHESATSPRIGIKEATEFVVGMKRAVEEMFEAGNPDCDEASRTFQEATERLGQIYWENDARIRKEVEEHEQADRMLRDQELYYILSSARRGVRR